MAELVVVPLVKAPLIIVPFDIFTEPPVIAGVAVKRLTLPLPDPPQSPLQLYVLISPLIMPVPPVAPAISVTVPLCPVVGLVRYPPVVMAAAVNAPVVLMGNAIVPEPDVLPL